MAVSSDAPAETVPSDQTAAPEPQAPSVPKPSSSVERPATSPTIYVTYGTKSVKARIDREVPLEEIIRQLAASSQLAVSEPPALFALREKDTNELVTEENLGRFLARGQSFVLTSSPTIEAAEMVEKLNAGEQATLKLATFSLRTLIRERAFLTEFLARGGLLALQQVIQRSSGNTLAYSLLSFQNLMDLEEQGYQSLQPGFIERIVDIIAKEPLINITRPATAILRRISQQSAVGSTSKSESGFHSVYAEVTKQSVFLKTIIERLSSGDVAVANSSLILLNILFRGSLEAGFYDFGEELEKLNAWKEVTTLADMQESADVATILAFQVNLKKFLLHLSSTPVDEAHFLLFDQIWIASDLPDDDEVIRWRRLGFKTENPQFEFKKTGVLGLKALAKFATTHPTDFKNAVREMKVRPEDRRCPLAVASTTVVSLLAEHFSLSDANSGRSTPTPFLLRFYECHDLALQFFLRIWQESNSSVGDLTRMGTLTRSQIAVSLGGHFAERSWSGVCKAFLETSYKSIRDRQIRDTETEDDLLSKAPVRSLRSRLYHESYEFVRNQRLICLHEGAWFLTPASLSTTSGVKKNASQSRTWRFYRLAPNRKALHFVERAERTPVRGGLVDMPERIDLALVTDIAPTGVASQTTPRGRNFSITSMNSSAQAPFPTRTTILTPPNSDPNSSSMSISIHSADGILAELIAQDQATYSEWLDGLSLLQPEGNILTKETADFVRVLTEIGVKVKLLDLSGEKVEIPSSIPVGPVPISTQFYYSDSM